MKIQWISRNEVITTNQLCVAIDSCEDGVIGIGSPDIVRKLPTEMLDQWLHDIDIVHGGLSLGGAEAFNSLQLCAFNWHFINPELDKPAVSWKATCDFVLFEKRLIQSIGKFDNDFLSPDAALMDFTYRAMTAGAKVIHQPLPDDFKLLVRKPLITLQDEMLFVSKHFNENAQHFYRFCQFFLHGKWGKVSKNKYSTDELIAPTHFKLLDTKHNVKIDSYSALIPTINRYDYIGRSIDSLLSLKFPPSEIIVVDQTPLGQRKSEIYDPYLKIGCLKLIFLDNPGQSTARNRGLLAASNPWVLLFEDDSEAWPDMIDEHINLIKKSGCDVSTGVIVPPGADRTFIPVRNRKYFLSDIFTTGNAFMKVETALAVGGLDPAFDHGPGADDDFGKRLYRSGKIIVYNYKSIETHHKAPQGGMREHGIWWRNKSTLFGPYPPATQSFMIMKYYPSRFYFPLFLNMIFKARKKYSSSEYVVFLFLLPYKLFISIKKGRRLLNSNHENSHFKQ